jgi:hypothetical protein
MCPRGGQSPLGHNSELTINNIAHVKACSDYSVRCKRKPRPDRAERGKLTGIPLGEKSNPSAPTLRRQHPPRQPVSGELQKKAPPKRGKFNRGRSG